MLRGLGFAIDQSSTTSSTRRGPPAARDPRNSDMNCSRFCIVRIARTWGRGVRPIGVYGGVPSHQWTVRQCGSASRRFEWETETHKRGRKTHQYCNGPEERPTPARGGGHEPLKSISLSLEAALCRAASTPSAPRLLVTSRRLAPFLPVADHSTPPASIVVAHPEDAPPRPTTATAPAPATASATWAPAENNAPSVARMPMCPSRRVSACPPVSALCMSSALGHISSREARDERRRVWPASYLMRDAIRRHQWQSARDERRRVLHRTTHRGAQ